MTCSPPPGLCCVNASSDGFGPRARLPLDRCPLGTSPRPSHVAGPDLGEKPSGNVLCDGASSEVQEA